MLEESKELQEAQAEQEEKKKPAPKKKTAKKKTTKRRKKKKTTMSRKPLVIVESPTKARTLERFLGSKFKVLASQGHVMDLPASRLGVDVENEFEPDYIVIFKKRKFVRELREEAARHKILYLATDSDREGEAISAHLNHLMGEGKEVYRTVFHEITPNAIQHAFDNPVEMNVSKVDAQLARRILDRILGYSLSPLLWKKVGRGLSAGRVQSVVLKIIVDREREIRAFVPVEYWKVEALLEKLQAEDDPYAQFRARLETIDGEKADLKNEADSMEIVEGLKKTPFTVSKITKKEQKRNPSPPYTTSTMQQDAFNKIGFSSARTMRVAQQLYEGIDLGEQTIGLITYMRTDSVSVAKDAQNETLEFVGSHYGPDYVPEKPREYKSKKSAQEAHEAIRPTSVNRTPEAVKEFLTPDQYKLYRVIWNRFVASQMASAKVEVTTIDLEAGRCGFRASGTRILFPGFMEVFKEDEAKKAKKKKKDDEEERDDDSATSSQFLPELTEGETVRTLEINPSQHFTKPPPRYTEASLVRTMEELGIGRPSTYAPTLQTITSRGYVSREGRSLQPQELGEIVTDLLSEHFPKVLDVQFTASMEEELDLIEEEGKSWRSCVKEFYGPFAKALETAQEEMQSVKREPEPIDEHCPQCNTQLVIKWGRNGKFICCPGFPDCRFTKSITTGVQCPEEGCEGELVQRRSRRGAFYGCTKYPDCTHISRTLPKSESEKSDEDKTEESS